MSKLDEKLNFHHHVKDHLSKKVLEWIKTKQVLLTRILLKRTGRWASLWLLWENLTSRSCFETSGLKEVFH